MSSLEKLLLLADKKIEYLEQILLISKQQDRCIEDDEFEKIDELLNRKDDLIESINKIDSKFNEIKSDDLLNNIDLKNKLDSIKEILIKIKLIDDTHRDKMKISMEQTKNDLKRARLNQRAMQQYSKSDPYQAFASYGGTLFIDEDS